MRSDGKLPIHERSRENQANIELSAISGGQINGFC
jgi:hypothetical protein